MNKDKDVRGPADTDSPFVDGMPLTAATLKRESTYLSHLALGLPIVEELSPAALMGDFSIRLSGPDADLSKPFEILRDGRLFMTCPGLPKPEGNSGSNPGYVALVTTNTEYAARFDIRYETELNAYYRNGQLIAAFELVEVEGFLPKFVATDGMVSSLKETFKYCLELSDTAHQVLKEPRFALISDLLFDCLLIVSGANGGLVYHVSRAAGEMGRRLARVGRLLGIEPPCKSEELPNAGHQVLVDFARHIEKKLFEQSWGEITFENNSYSLIHEVALPDTGENLQIEIDFGDSVVNDLLLVSKDYLGTVIVKSRGSTEEFNLTQKEISTAGGFKSEEHFVAVKNVADFTLRSKTELTFSGQVGRGKLLLYRKL